MVVHIIPPTTRAELEQDLTLIRSACAGTSDPELIGLHEAIASHALGDPATVDEVENAWRAMMKRAETAIVSMKKSLAAHLRAGTAPAGARDELRALAAAVAAIKRQRELKRSR